MVEIGRRLDDAALPGAENMGRDQALLECRLIPSLRFYRWLRPTLSLGYFQAAADLPLQELRARGCDLLRRVTGGKAILHESELTYSLCVPEVGVMSGGPAACMKVIHQAFAGVLQEQIQQTVQIRQQNALLSDVPNSAWCFEDSSSLDLTLQRRKLLGSAARRSHGWILFHGSLVLAAPTETPGIAALGQEPQLDELSNALGKVLGYRFETGTWSATELSAANRAQKLFKDPNFLLRR